ncbi:DoxX family protein [Sphingopyxis sp. PET50]|uniref:DoxX family protein n=1 Tax=Sphingopyxis sp. PET50 TaxID=2976533 RepID=UPI0021B037BC|nr:DoxX family protein [Sphingopyxis sp. PET50]
MMKFLDGYSEQAYALLRIVANLLFLAHGVQKFLNFPVPFPYPLNPMLIAAGAIELIAGTMIVIGALTRPAAFIASGMSAVGYWVAHGTQGPFPIANNGETIALYCFLFLYIATRGAGIWSADGAMKK